MTGPEAFFHVRILVGIITALSVSRLITGLARPVQEQDWHRVGLVHAGWAVFLLLMVVHFWWFELGLSRIEKWTFGLYLFVITYAILLFLACTILFPDAQDKKTNLEEYFYSRQKWFYGLLAVIFLVDVADTAFKGLDHLRALGVEYLLRQTAFVVLSVIGMFVRPPLYHRAFVAGGILYQVSWAVRQFEL